MTKGSRLISARCPKPIQQQLERICKDNGFTYTYLILKGLEAVLPQYEQEQGQEVKG